MKALSICQPWPWAILHRGKRVENRTWGTSYRGPLAIHASKSRDCLGGFGPGEPQVAELVFGAIVGVCELAACVELARARCLTHEQEEWLRGHPFTEGPVCWVLKNVRTLPEPVPCKGGRGLWDVPAEVLTKLSVPATV